MCVKCVVVFCVHFLFLCSMFDLFIFCRNYVVCECADCMCAQIVCARGLCCVCGSIMCVRVCVGVMCGLCVMCYGNARGVV